MSVKSTWRRLTDTLLYPNLDERNRRRTIAIAEAGWRAARLASTVGLIALDYKFHHYSSGASSQQGKVCSQPRQFRQSPLGDLSSVASPVREMSRWAALESYAEIAFFLSAPTDRSHMQIVSAIDELEQRLEVADREAKRRESLLAQCIAEGGGKAQRAQLQRDAKVRFSLRIWRLPRLEFHHHAFG